MTTRSRLSSGVRNYCGDPPDTFLPEGLPEHTIFEVLSDVETSLLIDVNLSDQNRRISSKTVTLNTAWDFAVNNSTLSVPAFAQFRYNSTDTWHDPVDIVNAANLDRAAAEGRLAVAFYGNPLRARTSWVPSGGELILWFDKSIDGDGALTDSPAIEDAYTVHLKLQAAAQCLELMKQPVGDVLKVRIAKGEEQWKKYVKLNGQQGLIRKTSSHPRAGRSRGQFRTPNGMGWI